MRWTLTTFFLLAFALLLPGQQEPKIKDGENFCYAALEVKGPYEQMPAKIGELMAELMKQNLSMSYPMAFYFNSPAEVKPEDLLWEVGVQIDDGTQVNPPLKTGKFKYDKIVEMTYKGPYDSIGGTYAMLMKFIAENGLKPCGPVCETYLDDPNSVKPEECRTLIVIPVEKQ